MGCIVVHGPCLNLVNKLQTTVVFWCLMFSVFFVAVRSSGDVVFYVMHDVLLYVIVSAVIIPFIHAEF